ncbi:hypothetical protein F5Y10DRAFT_4238 [Nemania abortiva]|nr:hypothetical protein F5Y10DRAFT_4238 [Nemania abortiva]
MSSSRGTASSQPPASPDLGEAPEPQSRGRQGPRRDSQRYHRHNGKNSRPNHRRGHWFHNSKNSQGRRDIFAGHKTPWRSTDSLELGVHPRTFDILHANRIYLLSELHSQERRTMELLRQLPALEEQINYHRNAQHHHHQRPDQQHNRHRDRGARIRVRVDGIPVDEGNNQATREEIERGEEDLRNAQREHARLRQQIKDAVDAERRILAHLGELHVEIQSRERWCQIERERAGILYPPGPSYDGYGPEYTLHQHWHWVRYPYQNQPPHPGPYTYQPEPYGYDNSGTGYYQGPPPPPVYPNNTPVAPGHGYDGRENHAESDAHVDQQGGSPDEHGSRPDYMGQPAANQVDGGEHV